MGKKQAKLLLWASAELTADQEKFLSRYLSGGHTKKTKALRQETADYHDSVVEKLSLLDEIYSTMSPITSDEQKRTVDDLKLKRGAILNGIGISAKSTRDAHEKLKAADTQLTNLLNEAQGKADKFHTVDGTERDAQEAIDKLKSAGKSKLNDQFALWNAPKNDLLKMMRESGLTTGLDLPANANLDPVWRTLRDEIVAAPTDPGAEIDAVKTEIDGVVGRMVKATASAIKALDTYKAEGFQQTVVNSRLLMGIDAKLAELATLREKADRWDMPDRKSYAAEAKVFETRRDTIFSDKTKPEDAEGAAGTLSDDIGKLITLVDNKLNEAESAFNDEQAKYLEVHKGLAARIKSLTKKQIPDDQRTPVDTFLAATKDSIDKVGGSNAGALKAAKLMLTEALAMVKQAEEIGPLNEAVKENITNAKDTLKPLMKKKSSVIKGATELDGKVTKFAEEWLKKAPDVALRESRDLSSKAVDLESQNTTLLRLRAMMDLKIKEVETKYTTFNDTFKDMLKWMKADKVRDYRGSIRSDIDGVKTWNSTKLDIGFYSTISSRIDSISKTLDTQIADMTEAMKSSPEDLSKAVEDAKDAYEKELFGLKLEAGAGQIDQKAVDEAKAQYDEALRKNSVHTSLSADLLGEEEQERRNIADREKFLKDGKQWVKDTQSAVKKAKSSEPLQQHKEEVERQITRLEATLKAADNDKKGSTGTRGLSELIEVRGAVERIKQRGKAMSSKKLGDIPDEWRKGISAFATSKNALVTAVGKFEQDQRQTNKATKQIRTVLNKVQEGLKVDSLLDPASDLGTSDDPAVRKAAREKVLNEVRRMKKLLLDDPTMKTCVANPFGVAGFITTTIYRLEQIELDVLRGV